MQQMQYASNHVVPLPKGSAMCYVEGCTKIGKNVCTIYRCCTNLGCNRAMCGEHTSKKKCWCGANQNGCHRTVCKECEPKVIKRLRLACICIFVLVFLCIFVNLGVRVFFEYLREDEHEEEEH